MKTDEQKAWQLIPRVVAVHDLCGYGNCSLAIALPVLSAAGIDAVPLPTAVLSAHTAFSRYTFVDLTDSMADTIEHWRDMAFQIDGIYTGFLGSAAQIKLLASFFQDDPTRTIVVDPVMADHGKIYKTYTPEMCQGMKKLAAKADILTPNLTEAAVLLDRPYTGQTMGQQEAKALCSALSQLGASRIVLKGIERENGRVYNAVCDDRGNYVETSNPKAPDALHGTGDLFASVVTAAVMRGVELIEAVDFAGHLVYDAIQLSTKQPGYRERGVSYEPLVGRIANFIGGKADPKPESPA